MTLVYCTMLWKWMRKSSHILRKVQTSVLYLKFLCYFSYVQASTMLWTRAILIVQVT
jgi:hypothetical protein